MASGEQEPEEHIVDFHIKRGRERAQYVAWEEEKKQGDMYHLKHSHRCVCYAPQQPLYSSLWPLYGHQFSLQPNDNPIMHDHRLFALTGRFNYLESEWKTIDILEFDFDKRIWKELTSMPSDYVKAHFQQQTWSYLRAYSHEGKIFICRTDGMTQGAIYDIDRNVWDLDWQFPIAPNGMAWFSAISPFQGKLNQVPWEKYLQRCHTHGLDE